MTAPLRQGLTALCWLCLIFGNQPAWSGVLSAAGNEEVREDASGAQGSTSAEPTLEERIAKARTKLEEAHKEVSIAEAMSAAALPPGISTEDLQEHQDMLRWLVSWYAGQLNGLEGLKDLHRSRAQLEAEMQSWQGYADPTVLSAELLEQLWSELYTKTRELEAITVKQRALATLTEESRKQLKDSEQQLRQASERAEQAQDPDEKAREIWHRDQAALRDRVNQAKVLGTEAQLSAVDETAAYVQQELGFLQRKVRQASELSSFSQADLDARLAEVARQRAETVRKLADAERREFKASDNLAQVRDQIQQARNRVSAAAEPDATLAAEVATLESVFQAREAEADTATAQTSLLQLSVVMLDREKSIWEQRYALARSRDSTRITQTLREIRSLQERVTTWKSTVFSGLDADLTALAAQRRRLEDWKPEYGDADLGREALAAIQERIALRQSLLDHFEHNETLLLGWSAELQQQRDTLSLMERGMSLGKALAGFGVRLWNIELFTVDDTIVVDGEKVSGKRSVTVGKIALVLLVIIVGYWVVRRLAGLLQRVAAAGAHGDAIRGLLVYRLSYLVLLIGLIILALTMVNIPLTAFAFLGGTVALAVGFGGQNLANNFISGLILMMERPIKIGDIVEIEGVRGKVINIGARSCQIRRFDGVEILVPNSDLLEKSVTNVTLSDPRTRLTVRVGVAYGSPTRETERLIADVIKEHPHVLKDPAPCVLFEDFGDDALVFNAYFWVELREDSDSRVIVSDIRHRIDERCREAGIEIAFPQRDVHLDTTGPIQIEIASSQDVARQRPEAGMPPGDRKARSR
jgi:small-conductance mechanosensitive channel